MEAVRDSSNRSLALVNDEIKALELEIEPPPGTFDHKEEADFWLELPRTFSFTSARFELPLDMSSLVNMTPVEYLAKHVTITSSRRQLYDKVKNKNYFHYIFIYNESKVFTRNRSSRDGLLTEEATMIALGEVMGGLVKSDLVSKIWSIIGVEIAPHIENKFNYSQFSGIAAFTERIYCWEFCRGDNAGPSTPKSEIETADFDKLLSKLERVKIPEVLRDLLVNLKESGHPKASNVPPRRKFSKNQNIFDFL